MDTLDLDRLKELYYIIDIINTIEKKNPFHLHALLWKWKKNVFLFLKLYEKTGKELCVVVTNLNHMTEEYCHVKTTPDMPIRLAVRMSMAIPGD